MKKVKYSIVIPTYKPNPELLKRLQIYLKTNIDDQFEVHIVDGKNGLANAYNEGIKMAKGDVVITIHSDCVPFEKDALQKLTEPFINKRVVLTYAWIKEEDRKKKYFPEIPDGKFNAFRKSALIEVGMFDESTFFTGGEDVDIWIKLKKIGKVVKVSTGVLHTHPNYRGNKTLDKRKQNGQINGCLFRIHGTKNPKWLKALIMCLLHPKTYGKYFVEAYKKGKQEYRRGE